MDGILWGLVIGFPSGLVVGVVIALSITCCLMCQKSCNTTDELSCPRKTRLPIQAKGPNSGAAMPGSTTVQDLPRTSGWSNMAQCLEGLKRKSLTSDCGIRKYAFKYV